MKPNMFLKPPWLLLRLKSLFVHFSCFSNSLWLTLHTQITKLHTYTSGTSLGFPHYRCKKKVIDTPYSWKLIFYYRFPANKEVCAYLFRASFKIIGNLIHLLKLGYLALKSTSSSQATALRNGAEHLLPSGCTRRIRSNNVPEVT